MVLLWLYKRPLTDRGRDVFSYISVKCLYPLHLIFCGFPSVFPSVIFTSTKQYLLNYSVHSYYQKVKIIKQILTFVEVNTWSYFSSKRLFTSHARWIRLLLEAYYHYICIILHRWTGMSHVVYSEVYRFKGNFIKLVEKQWSWKWKRCCVASFLSWFVCDICLYGG